MIHASRLVTALLLSVTAYFLLGSTSAASKHMHSGETELDHLIPREKWTGAGLNKLTVIEQQTLADDIAALLGSERSTQNSPPAGKDRNQWRMLQRHMTKEDVKKLLGEPVTVSVSRFFESWYYQGGTVTFNGKGRVDMWSED